MRGALQWQTVQVLNDDLGQPNVDLLGDARALLSPNAAISVTLSDERRYAVAFALHHTSPGY